MAGIYSKYSDAPGQIKKEGQDITLKFVRVDDTTGIVSWNIPRPSVGCDANTQAYDGIVITVDNKAANYMSTSPSDGNYYDGDPTSDKDLHLGSKLDTALVVGAFYNDKKTTSLTITNLSPRTPYYVSGYAVDAQARYHREGVHAYSIPDNVGKKLSPDLSAYQDVAIVSSVPVKPSDLTGLESNREYSFAIQMCCKRYDYKIHGRDGLTYKNLVDALNRAFAESICAHTGPNPPNTGEYFLNLQEESLYLWDGWKYIPQELIWSITDPSIPEVGVYWYDTDDKKLYIYESHGWVEITRIITQETNPTNPMCGQVWFDGVDVWEWDGNHWCKLCVIISERNPLLPPILSCNSFWFDETREELFRWEAEYKKWTNADALYYHVDPNALPQGTFWYDETTEKMMVLESNGFHAQAGVSYVDNMRAVPPAGTYYYSTEEELILIANGRGGWEYITEDKHGIVLVYSSASSDGRYRGPPNASPGLLWFTPDTLQLRQRNEQNSGWITVQYEVDEQYKFDMSTGKFYTRDDIHDDWYEVLYISAPFDPRDRKSCDIWWNSETDVLQVWDAVNQEWVEAEEFHISSIDPKLPRELPECSVWYNPATGKIIKILSPLCEELDTIFSEHDPVNLPSGYIWHIPSTDEWKVWDGLEWNLIQPIYSANDPYLLEDGIFWYNPQDNELQHRVDGDWETTFFSGVSLVPSKGTLWMNTEEDMLMEWDGVTWIPSNPFVYVEFLNRTCREDREVLRFSVKKRGCTDCDTEFKIIVETDNLFTHLRPSVMYYDPVDGATGLVAGPTYAMLGIGDEGDPAERRELADTIRIALGAPNITVELTKEQLDFAIDNALLVLRKRSSYGYLRGFFFFDIQPNQQIYKMTNECVGFNKIVDINTIYRVRGAAFKSAYAWNDAFSFAALQQMYTLGTFDILTYHLTSSYMEELETLFAERIMFQWTERTRELKLHNYLRTRERVLIDCVLERSEQDLLTDRETRHFLQRWAIMEAKFMLSQVRGKYTTLPGPNGSTTLNSQELITQAETERTLLEEELADMVMQDAVNTGMRSHFLLG